MKTLQILNRMSVPLLLVCVLVFGMGQEGCETTGGAMQHLSAAGYRSMATDPNWAKTPQQSQAFMSLANVIDQAGYVEDQKAVAREGRSQINVNVNQPQQTYSPAQATPQQHPHVVQLADGKCHPEEGWTWLTPTEGDFDVKPVNTAYVRDGEYRPEPGYEWVTAEPNDYRVRKKQAQCFACNYWRDFNGNGNSEPDEYVGRKNKFRLSESITLICDDIIGKKGESERVELLDSNGNTVRTWTGTVEYESNRVSIDLKTAIPNPGSYAATVYIGDKHYGTVQLEITE